MVRKVKEAWKDWIKMGTGKVWITKNGAEGGRDR